MVRVLVKVVVIFSKNRRLEVESSGRGSAKGHAARVTNVLRVAVSKAGVVVGVEEIFQNCN